MNSTGDLQSLAALNAISYIMLVLALEHRENFDSFVTGFLISEGEYGFSGEYNPQFLLQFIGWQI